MTQLDLQQRLEQAEAERDALQQQVNALAAENLAMTKFISQSCYSYDGDGSDVCDSYVMATSSPWFPKTPATDVIKRKWMAEGVESFVSNVTHKVFAQEEAAQALLFLRFANKFCTKLRQPEEKGYE